MAPDRPALSAGRIRSAGQRGFSLIEILVACVILSMIMMLMLSVVNHASGLWKSSNARIDAFQNARLAYENMKRLLSQACLNTYWDYNDANDPKRYIRKSELHFLVDDAATVFVAPNFSGQAVFFQAPAVYSRPDGDDRLNAGTDAYGALPGLLNACGFYVEFASDKAKGWLPGHVQNQGRQRFRLMQWMESTQDLSVYQTSPGGNERAWITPKVLQDALPAAENVIALVIWPKEPEKQVRRVLPDTYSYDSRADAEANPQPVSAHQLPPMLQVAMIAMDEDSAVRLGNKLESTVQECLADRFRKLPSEFEGDLQAVEKDLQERRITYRTFISTIPLREAKWSPE